MKQNKVLQIVYTFFLGVMLAIFIGVGINTFYEPPAAPEYPVELSTYAKDSTVEQTAKQKEYDKKNAEYVNGIKPYNRNVSIITMVAAVALLAISILYEKKIKVISDGVMLGGLFTLIYSIGRGFASEDSKYMFVVVSIGLALVIYLGYHRFVGPNGNPQKTNKK